ncbi:MAG: transglutaminase-like domain-containing protein [Halobacteriota archaeon]
MTQVSAITEQGQASRESQNQLRLDVLSFARMLLKNPSALKKFRVMDPDEERYVRPPREYDLPAYRQGMKYCKSNENYLRPTRYCNPREPLVIALANELGAYELSDWEFADAAYWFIKTKFVVEMLPFDSVSETLRRGTGTCYHLISVWIALCRAAGIKARYKTFNMRLPQEVMSLERSGKNTREVFNTGGTPEGEGEVCIDGTWVVGHVAMRPEILAGLGLPITKLGEDAIGLTLELVPGTIRRFESIPLKLAVGIKALMWLAPAAMERTSIAAQTRMLPVGEKVIAEAGGMQAYDKRARERLGFSAPTIEVKKDTALVFEA